MNKQKLAYKKLGNVSLFDDEETLDKLNSLGNPLVVPRLPRFGQRRQSARCPNNMGVQKRVDGERSF